MASQNSPTSFSARRRWGIFFSVIISIVAMVALIAMVNYLGARYYKRFSLSRQTEVKLSPQTLFLLKSITNDVKVTILYDTQDSALYSHVVAWLDEYHLANPKVTVQTVDYKRSPGMAQQVKAAYKLGSADDKDLVIFDCNGRHKVIRDTQLADYELVQVPNDKQREFEEHLKGFNGEMRFTPALLSVVNRKPRKAYFLEGNGEHSLEAIGNDGYSKFGEVLEQNGVSNAVLRLTGTNAIPSDCNLLVIAGPQKVFPPEQLAKIRQYLSQGGRMMVMFNYFTRHTPTGLESILAEWNINVGMNMIGDMDDQAGEGGPLVVSRWNNNHPLSAPLFSSKSVLNMILPRSIEVLNDSKSGPETPKVEMIATTGPHATIAGSNDKPAPAGEPKTLIVAMEKESVKGVFQERGTTAIVAVGDSIFLDNYAIEAADNREFARFAVNWLLDQTELLQGVGPHPVKEYKLTMTQSQMKSVSWVFLGAMPGAILVFGGLVWFRRRH